jgi:hypothetical protein
MWRGRKTPYYHVKGNITNIAIAFHPMLLSSSTLHLWMLPGMSRDTILTGHDIFAGYDSLNDPYE